MNIITLNDYIVLNSSINTITTDWLESMKYTMFWIECPIHSIVELTSTSNVEWVVYLYSD